MQFQDAFRTEFVVLSPADPLVGQIHVGYHLFAPLSGWPACTQHFKRHGVRRCGSSQPGRRYGFFEKRPGRGPAWIPGTDVLLIPDMIQLVQQLYQSVWLVKTKRLLSLVAKGELA
jgi:hypothetical protein